MLLSMQTYNLCGFAWNQYPIHQISQNYYPYRETDGFMADGSWPHWPMVDSWWLLAALVHGFLHHIDFIGLFLFGGFRWCIPFRWFPGSCLSGPVLGN